MTTNPASPPDPQSVGHLPGLAGRNGKLNAWTMFCVLLAIIGLGTAFRFLQQARAAKRDAALASQEAHEIQQVSEQETQVAELLFRALSSAKPAVGGGEPTLSDILQTIEGEVSSLDTELAQARVELGVAKIYNHLGKFSYAAAAARVAVDLLADRVKADSKEMLVAQAHLASNQLMAGDLPEGTKLTEQLLEETEDALDASDPLRLAILNASANADFMRGDIEQGLAKARQVIHGREDTLPDEDPNLLFALTTQVRVLIADGEVEKAIPIAQRLSDLWDDYNPKHIAAIAAHSTLANLLTRQGGSASQSAEAHRAVVDRLRVELGENDEQTLRVSGNYLLALVESKDFQRAIEEGEPTVARCIEHLPSDSPITAMTKNSLALAYHFSGRSADAVPLLQQVLVSTRAALGDADAKSLEVIRNLFKIQMAAGLLDESLAMGTEAVQLMRTHLGPEDPRTQDAISSLAEVCVAGQWYGQAADLLTDHYQWRKQSSGNSHAVTLSIGTRLAELLRHAGRPEQAAAVAQEVGQTVTQEHGPNHALALATRISAARAYLDAGKSTDAKATAEDVLGRCIDTLGPADGLTCDARACLIAALLAEEEYSEAETIARELFTTVRDAPFANTLRIALAANLIGEAQLRQGNSAGAQRLLSAIAQKLEEEHPNHTLTAATEILLGEALLDRQELDAAEEKLLQGQQLLASLGERLSADELKRLDGACAQLAKLYEAKGQPKDAAKWRDRQAAETN